MANLPDSLKRLNNSEVHQIWVFPASLRLPSANKSDNNITKITAATVAAVASKSNGASELKAASQRETTPTAAATTTTEKENTMTTTTVAATLPASESASELNNQAIELNAVNINHYEIPVYFVSKTVLIRNLF